MQHIGIDLGGRQSQICVRSADGDILSELKIATVRLGRFFKTQPLSRVVVETCSEAFAVADFALECEHEVRA